MSQTPKKFVVLSKSKNDQSEAGVAQREST